MLCGTVPLIAVKCGRNGALVQHGERRIAVPGLPVEPVDTIGAGDSFNAGFLSAWLGGASPEECDSGRQHHRRSLHPAGGGTEAFRDRAFVTEFLRWNPLPRRQP